jgi:hypothetical protein
MRELQKESFTVAIITILDAITGLCGEGARATQKLAMQSSQLLA